MQNEDQDRHLDGGAAEAQQAVQRGAVLLVLDSTMQTLPWESVPGLRQQRCVCWMYAAASINWCSRSINVEGATVHAMHASCFCLLSPRILQKS